MSCSYLIHAFILAWTCFNSLVTASSSGESDRLVLLAIKENITSDPFGAIRSWNNSLHHCQWSGVRCSSRRHRDRVTVLDLEYQKLEGTLSPHIGNLSFLRMIALTENSFQGPIPQEIGRLSRLQELYFYSNSFQGDIPTKLSDCSNLRIIVLKSNKLWGEIPVELTSLPKLTKLDLSNNELKGRIPRLLGNLSSLNHLLLSYNSFTGNIPDALCDIQNLQNFKVAANYLTGRIPSCFYNLTSLVDLSLIQNTLTGSIPDELCNIRNLKYFEVSVNNLTGKVPSCLYNLSHIRQFAVTENKLYGILPSDIGLTLPNLEGLFVGGNQFTGLIPTSLPNASRLEKIEFGLNQFTGQIPRDLGRLKNLRLLSFFSNQLGSTSSAATEDLEFITSLTNCTFLEKLLVSNNFLKGSMPIVIANLSTAITQVYLGYNEIHGRIPAGLENLINMTILAIQNNHLTGEIPEVIGMLPSISVLDLGGNQFSGEIPNSFHNATKLLTLFLARNNLYGPIPLSLGDCQQLSRLDLSHNNLHDTIPKQIFGLSSLTILLDLSNNALSGPLPFEMRNLSNLVQLDISSNQLVGHIPSTLGECLNLVYLNMSGNSFQGLVPQSLIALKGLEKLDLSYNKLSGEIPKYLGNLTLLTYLNLSYNEFEGPLPDYGIFGNASAISVDGNSKLCGGVTGLKLPPCNIKDNKGKFRVFKVVLPVAIGSLIFVASFCYFVYMVCQRRVSRKKYSAPLLDQQYLQISYAELLKATDNFSVDNLIGEGSYGSVYKGTLDKTNTIVAVKVLNLLHQGASKSFLSECSALRNIRHRNLIKIITSCSSVDFQGNDFKALVFEFFPNGSLEDWLHPKGIEQHESKNINFLQRLGIAIDIASALDYLHHHCQPRIIHCDLKPSNVLLDNEMVARVADFGLAKILSSFPSSHSKSQEDSLAIKGSIGYVAPEYGMGCEVSVQGDVYSYGILLLEMFTGKRPTSSMFQNGLTLHSFAKMALPEHVMNIVDPTMLLEDNHKVQNIEIHGDRRGRIQECLISTIKLGVACSSDSPMERMYMGSVINELCHIKDYYQGAELHSV